jgi:hypothetical protein
MSRRPPPRGLAGCIGWCRPSCLSDLSPTDVSPTLNLVCAELSLGYRRDRLLDVFPAEKSRSAVGLLEAGVDPGEHGLQPQETAPALEACVNRLKEPNVFVIFRFLRLKERSGQIQEGDIRSHPTAEESSAEPASV